MITDWVMVTGPYPAESSTTTSPPDSFSGWQRKSTARQLGVHGCVVTVGSDESPLPCCQRLRGSGKGYDQCDYRQCEAATKHFSSPVDAAVTGPTGPRATVSILWQSKMSATQRVSEQALTQRYAC
jgi:hypothetical protein